MKNGSISPESIPPIRVHVKNGKMYSVDNRRLYAFKEAGVNVKIKKISEAEWKHQTETLKKFTTQNDGISIRIRGGLE